MESHTHSMLAEGHAGYGVTADTPIFWATLAEGKEKRESGEAGLGTYDFAGRKSSTRH